MEGKRTSKEFSEFQVEFYELHPRIITFLFKSPFIVYGLTHGVLDTTAARPYDERAFQQPILSGTTDADIFRVIRH